MLKRDFFIEAIQHKAHYKRDWVMSVFGLIDIKTDDWRTDPFPYRVVKLGNGFGFLKPEVDGDPSTMGIVEITDSFYDDDLKPLAYWLERLDLETGEIENHTGQETIVTTYGNVLVNDLVLCTPFGKKVSFIKGEFNIGRLQNEIFERVVDTPDPVPPRNSTDDLYVHEYHLFGEHALSLVSYNTIAVQSITPKSLTGHPDARTLREKLKEKYKGQLTDPVIISKIGAELEKLDREWLKDDPADKFYQTNEGKYYGKVRKRLFYMFGGEAPFSDGTVMEFVERSLEEGIVPENLPIIINSLRHGTHSRGSQTQLGGEATKTIYRMVGTSRISEDDCGTTMGVVFKVTDWNWTLFAGFYEIVDGQSRLIDMDEMKDRVGSHITLRSPTTCKTADRNHCAKCMGVALAELRDGLAATSAQTSGVFLTSFLKAFHGKELKTKRLDVKHWLR